MTFDTLTEAMTWLGREHPGLITFAHIVKAHDNTGYKVTLSTETHPNPLRLSVKEISL